MSPEQFCRHYPYLYHMAEAGTWKSIREFGLLSTTALLDLFGVTGDERRLIESQSRREIVYISHAKYGRIAIRDNKPLPESKLVQCLTDGTTPEEWYRILNGKVFFWPTYERVLTLLEARPYRSRAHIVIKVRSNKLLEACAQRVSLSPINSGAAPYNPTPRGRYTFCKLEAWPGHVGPRSGKLKRPVAEVAVEYAVERVKGLVERVAEMHRTAETRVLWP